MRSSLALLTRIPLSRPARKISARRSSTIGPANAADRRQQMMTNYRRKSRKKPSTALENYVKYQDPCKAESYIFSRFVRDSRVSHIKATNDMQVALPTEGLSVSLSTGYKMINNTLKNGCVIISPQKPGGVPSPTMSLSG